MPTITVDATYQGLVQNDDLLGSINWGVTRDAGSGTVAQTYTTATTSTSIGSNLETARAGFLQVIYRTFLFFDLDIIPTEAKGNITSATLKVFGDGDNTTANSIPVRASAWGGAGDTSTLSTGNFNALTFGTPYGSEKTSWDNKGYNDYTLNSSAITDINTNRQAGFFDKAYFLNIAVIEHDYDYSNVTPSDPTDVKNDVRFLDSTSKIKLELTYPDPGSAIDKVIGIDYGGRVIDNINGVQFNDIGTVIGV